MNARVVRKIIVAAVALHSIALGIVMTFWPARMLALAGWRHEGGYFFPVQSGVLLLLLGVAYLAGVWRRELGWYIVLTKAAAVAFLWSQHLAAAAPGPVLLVTAGDGLMGAATAAALWVEGRPIRAAGE